VADAQGSKCDPQTPPFAVAKGLSGQHIRVGTDGRWMGLARWNPRRARRTAAAARRRCFMAGSEGGRGLGFALLDPQLACRHRRRGLSPRATRPSGHMCDTAIRHHRHGSPTRGTPAPCPHMPCRRSSSTAGAPHATPRRAPPLSGGGRHRRTWPPHR
jgi:hypothetical protein